MIYEKPEVNTLGSVRAVVGSLTPKSMPNLDAIYHITGVGNPAYDLDE